MHDCGSPSCRAHRLAFELATIFAIASAIATTLVGPAFPDFADWIRGRFRASPAAAPAPNLASSASGGALTFGSGVATVSSLTWSPPRTLVVLHDDGKVEWQGLDPQDVAAVESAALELPYDRGLLRALARLARLEAVAGVGSR